MPDSFYIKRTNSTNDLLNEMSRQRDLPEGFVVYTDFQHSGRGQQGNSWESEAGKNLLFSILLYPKQIPIQQQFIISQIVSIGIKKALDKYAGNISVKWPNDIYWNDEKLAGILIENSLQGANIRNSIVGIGLNVNQTSFEKAPNPVSLKQTTGKSIARKRLLKEIKESIFDIYRNWNAEQIHSEYRNMLYRNTGYFPYSAGNEKFEAKIIAIQPDGRLDLEDRAGKVRKFYFKEVRFESANRF